MTLDEAKNLRKGQTIYQTNASNKDGSRKRWKINGQVKTWKRNPNRIQIPVKYGLYSYDYLTEKELDIVSLEPR